MADLSITASVSPEDRAAIVADVVAAMRPLLSESHEPRLVDGDRMADLLGVSRPTVDRLRAAGEIPSVLLGRRRLYQPAAVVAALAAANENGSDSPC
ncbi:Helix-turn-helix domain protein [Novipirellula galeiformis]|uniref:Helix-turn-helix domain protein n=1 Tax=Novipirellula galeiformis TaxID=2528004 RepID=A0A5C6CQ33_9BACT|nr:helix-turn-helix domain-containing protein [Novipirellula galeiformis]TWU24899.1 Helix-turn-helix domain protein [Novipirellula galeiformis]